MSTKNSVTSSVSGTGPLDNTRSGPVHNEWDAPIHPVWNSPFNAHLNELLIRLTEAREALVRFLDNEIFPEAEGLPELDANFIDEIHQRLSLLAMVMGDQFQQLLTCRHRTEDELQRCVPAFDYFG
jgi:hypothetical protein